MPRMAMTTSSSTSVKPDGRALNRAPSLAIAFMRFRRSIELQVRERRIARKGRIAINAQPDKARRKRRVFGAQHGDTVQLNLEPGAGGDDFDFRRGAD